MKTYYSNLQCPHCGATNPKLIKEDTFLCSYCNSKFNYTLEEISFSGENKIFIQELKEEFGKRLETLQKERAKNRAMLNYYSHRANSRTLSRVILVLTIVFFITFLLLVQGRKFSLFAMLCPIVFLCLYGLSLIGYKHRYKKNKPFSMYYATQVVKIEEEIEFYTKLISRLTQ
ncbi:MAG: hypothetical protein J5903_01035 [Clostridia bacterium]|nr:hypothetical protein [Clostridia bacterium]